VKSWRIIFAALAVMLAPIWTSGTVEAQNPPTVQFIVVGYGPIATLEHDCPLDAQGKLTRYVPAEITCTLRALDAEGLWTPANFEVTLSGPPDRVTVEVVDSVLTIRIIRTTGLPGISVKIEAFPVLLVAVVYLERPLPYAQVDTVMPLNVVEGEYFQLCAYVGGYASATAKGMSSNGFNCPDFGGVPLPVFSVGWRGEGTPTLLPTPTVLARR